jgi:hypothetical protein
MNPLAVRDDAAAILMVWTPASGLKMQEITLEKFQEDYATHGQVLAAIDEAEAELLTLRNRRDELTEKLNNACMRARAGVKFYFGDDSTEYELVGGTRSSERKPRARVVKRAASPAAA